MRRGAYIRSIIGNGWDEEKYSEKRKAGIGTATEIAICDTTTKEHFGAGRFNGEIPVSLSVLHTL